MGDERAGPAVHVEERGLILAILHAEPPRALLHGCVSVRGSPCASAWLAPVVCAVLRAAKRQERAKSIPACGSWATLSTVGRTPSASPPVGAGAGAALGAMALCARGRVENAKQMRGEQLRDVSKLDALLTHAIASTPRKFGGGRVVVGA